jgi:pimeloyl-ACP methyl ester carboxylesterase
MPSFALPGLDLHYEVRGDGRPLLLIAGLASDSMSWLTVWNDLSGRRRAIAPDNRGAGRTRPQDGPVSVDEMADDCAALLRHLRAGQASVVGHSMGGLVAQRLALRHPGRVDRLVLAATGAAADPRDIALFRDMADKLDAGEDPARWFRRFFDVIFTRRFMADPANVEAATKWATDYPYAQSPRAFRLQVEALAAFPGVADAARIAVPALVLTGSEDVLFPPAEGEALARRIPGATFKVIDGAAHAIHTEQPKAFVDAVMGFIGP